MPFVEQDNLGIIAKLMIYCVMGVMVPDLDAVESKIKHVKLRSIKPFVPITGAINAEFGHRGLLHSLWGWVGWTILILPLGAVTSWLCLTALSLGYASHLVGDACTRTGIPLLYPSKKQFNLLPPGIRVITGSDYEEVFFVTLGLLSLIQLLTHLWD